MNLGLKTVSIGELAVDWLSLDDGESIMSASRFYRYVGGNATNVAVGLSRLGVDSAVISKVGADFHADYLLSSLEKEGVDTSWVARDPGQPTAQCYMVRRADGAPQYYAWPSPNASKSLCPEDIKSECFDNSWIWHAAATTFIARPRRQAMTYALEQARKRDKIISFDACFPLIESGGGRQAAFQAMQLADIVKFNQAEAAYWSDTELEADLDSKVERLLERINPTLCIVTLAQRGAMLYTRGQSAFCPPFPVQSIGDVGPGDAFSAGLIYGLYSLGRQGMERENLKKLDISVWLKLASYGACAGALVTRSYSATESFPRRDELNEAMGKLPQGS